jgi:hypothetical protein
MSALDFAELERLRGRRRTDEIVRVPCPACSHLRQRRHQRAPCLSLWAKGGGEFITFDCRHCGIKGYARREGTARQVRAESRGRATTAASIPVDYAQRQRSKALWMWRASVPAIGTIAETYLRSRGITCATSPRATSLRCI